MRARRYARTCAYFKMRKYIAKEKKEANTFAFYGATLFSLLCIMKEKAYKKERNLFTTYLLACSNNVILKKIRNFFCLKLSLISSCLTFFMYFFYERRHTISRKCYLHLPIYIFLEMGRSSWCRTGL